MRSIFIAQSRAQQSALCKFLPSCRSYFLRTFCTAMLSDIPPSLHSQGTLQYLRLQMEDAKKEPWTWGVQIPPFLTTININFLIQGGPKVGIQYIVYYCIPTFGPPCMYPTRCNVTQFVLSGNCSTCFGWYHHPSSGAKTTVPTASGICHTVTAICRYRGRVGTGLSVLWVAYWSDRSVSHSQHTQTSSNSSTIGADSNNGVTNTICCRYSCLHSWWWVMVPFETCRAVSR